MFSDQEEVAAPRPIMFYNLALIFGFCLALAVDRLFL